MKKPKTLWIRFNKETHKPEFIGIEEPLENGASIITTIYGNGDSITIPIPDEKEEENEQNKKGKKLFSPKAGEWCFPPVPP